MDFSQPKKHLQKSNKKRLTNEQVKLLETSFNFNNKLDLTRKSQLAQELGVPARQIAIWYQNKRARWRNQSLEMEHQVLQRQLECVSSDKNRLEREVERLKGELEKAKEMLVSSKTIGNLQSFSSSCDEVRSSSLLGDQGDFYVCFDDVHLDHKSFIGHDFFC
ncbi:homeobox-leucine zipper protein ATHB-52-like [Rutidosis leptorrhynchoides]|uniref:homeobox-leucine zipper protein ATHB-52-like n=1 Tax=Rutidosis leptorrhynchoides TaxID=125765 RepID=UPI003A9A0169